MDNYVKAQMALHGPITNAFANFKRVGQDKMTKGLAKAHLDRLNERYQKLKQNHQKMLSLSDYDPKHEYVTSDLFETICDDYYSAKGAFNDFLDQFDTSVNLDESVLNRTGNYGPAVSTFAQLPRVELPTFTGDLHAWEPFKDLFRSLIHRRSDITAVVKFHHLRSHLSGEPAELIKSLPITADNYDIAWDNLCKNYGSKRRLVAHYAKTILSCRAMKSDSLSELKKLQTEMLSSLDSLVAIERNVGDADLFIELVISKFEIGTKRDWQRFLGFDTGPPTLEQLRNFFFHQALLLEGIGERNSAGRQTHHKVTTAHASNSENSNCSFCEESHSLKTCPVFKSKTVTERKEHVFKNKRCLNCLGLHFVKECTSRNRCNKCNSKHHSLLHTDKPTENSSSHQAIEEDSESESGEESLSSVNQVNKTEIGQGSGVLLCTARVLVKCSNGGEILVRALIDQGSQCSMISQSLCDLLKLKQQRANTRLIGPGEVVIGRPRFSVLIEISPHFSSSTSLRVEALVLPRVSSYRPPKSTSLPSVIKGLRLADPQFMHDDQIDMILGAAVHAEIISGTVKKGLSHEPIVTASKFGWLLSGPAGSDSSTVITQTISINCVTLANISETLQNFWRLEELPDRSKELSPEEQECEDHFLKTFKRTESGRFVVGLPFKVNPSALHAHALPNHSSSKAMLLQMEKRFKQDDKLKEAYSAFMREYLELNQMSEFVPTASDNYWLLPHHGVIRESSTTTKLRVVYNGSAKSKGSISLNEILHSGPNLLPCLFDLLLRWRHYRIAFTADIEKMFRQILVRESDQAYQTIYWRFNEGEPIKIYKLLTVTYGLACSPFLATRVVKQLAHEGEKRFPKGAEALSQDVYMDDVLSGAHSESEAMLKIKQLQSLTQEGGFLLRKWSSNNRNLIHNLSPELLMSRELNLTNVEDSVTVLGLVWLPDSDTFCYKVKLDEFPEVWTKRLLLSRLAKLFDPLGWISPLIITAKIIMQSLWILKLDWDDPLPSAHTESWLRWLTKLPYINQLKIPRWNYYLPQKVSLEIHGYSDASKLAYAAVLYLRVVDGDQVHVSLQLAKTKVAPIKTISIPRLELCAAHLLAKLTNHFLKETKLSVVATHLWTDSKDVLHWLNALPSKWPVFIANRCADIQSLVPRAHWHHVPGKLNPADIASRGIYPEHTPLLEQWHKGPELLRQLNPIYPKFNDTFEEVVTSQTTATPYPVWDLLSRYSDYEKLSRVTAYCLRFVSKLLFRCKEQSVKGGEKSLSNFPFLSLKVYQKAHGSILSPMEIYQAKLYWIAVHQRHFFYAEFKVLKENADLPFEKQKSLPPTSKLWKLAPFLDKGLIRVGGRLQNSRLEFCTKHPLALFPDEILTTSIIRSTHIRCLHGGPRITLVTLRHFFWIVGGLQTIGSVISHCVICRRYAGRTQSQMMSPLPTPRVLPVPAFTKTGIDYAGPVKVRLTKSRGKITTKGWIAVFVCMCTRAIHLEIVEDYSSESFIAAFIRFTARRGSCAELYSDRGTNFIGAEKQLAQMLQEYSQSYPKAQLTNLGTVWKYNPPNAPHFGGIWEAAVKSTKYHIKRVIGDQVLTFVGYCTLLCRIEVLLNSRPLVPMTGGMDDLTVITPAYLLNLKEPYVVPEPKLYDVNVPPFRRWQFLSHLAQQFWKRWSAEYLTSLQAREKWQKPSRSIRPGDLVLIKGEDTPPGSWPLGRVLKVFPGKDSLIRVASIKTCSTTLTRPIHRLILLVESDQT